MVLWPSDLLTSCCVSLLYFVEILGDFHLQKRQYSSSFFTYCVYRESFLSITSVRAEGGPFELKYIYMCRNWLQSFCALHRDFRILVTFQVTYMVVLFSVQTALERMQPICTETWLKSDPWALTFCCVPLTVWMFLFNKNRLWHKRYCDCSTSIVTVVCMWWIPILSIHGKGYKRLRGAAALLWWSRVSPLH